MEASLLPEQLLGFRIHLVGAKGTGMAALAEILAARGARLSGSDVADRFYTDAILDSIGLKPAVGFEPSHIGAGVGLVIHSAAYPRDVNAELIEAARRGIPIMSYPEALGAFSRRADSSGIAGVHGKTTTTALVGSIIARLGLPATILAGSAVSAFGGHSTLIHGERYFVAETCEYRRHFLSFRPRRIVLTSVESDHQDYYPRYEDILAAFVDYTLLLPPGGELIYCADDRGACEAKRTALAKRPDIIAIPYGRLAKGDYRLLSYATREGRAIFRLAGFSRDFELRVPGEHLALDAAAALALSFSILRAFRGVEGVELEKRAAAAPSEEELSAAIAALSSFSGSKRRSEILGEAGGVLFMDDYGHHPTAVRETIRGIKAFWPGRRLVVDFMSHTYSRTSALFDDFVACLDAADAVVLHKIYASAREAPPEGGVTGRDLYQAVAARRKAAGSKGNVLYFEEPLEALEPLCGELKAGDIFLTMGAGDNFRLGEALLSKLKGREGSR
jgi:UDP-N-acetylmuramate--alanine ligase